MYKEKFPSLFLPRLVVALLIVVLLSGMTEVAFLAASFKNQTNYKLTGQKVKISHESIHDSNDIGDGITNTASAPANN
ncbi:MAG: hypothetical protein JWR50_3673 [Mucilaginibacter sp.]|nr:hypothetical protein [Mucilaginibacter sp.]